MGIVPGGHDDSSAAQQQPPNHASAVAIIPSSLLVDYIDKTQLAKELDRTQRTIDTLILRGDGPPYVQIGNKKLFRREAVLDWLRAREVRTRRQSKPRVLAKGF